jgi:hypothetical protein
MWKQERQEKKRTPEEIEHARTSSAERYQNNKEEIRAGIKEYTVISDNQAVNDQWADEFLSGIAKGDITCVA